MALLIWILMALTWVFLGFLNDNDGPTNIRLMCYGIILICLNLLMVIYNPNNKLLMEASGLTGGAIILICFKNILTKEDNLKTAGDWRKNLYKLEQKPYYTIDDLYELNSYINPYSQKNKVSIIVNEVIVSILVNHDIKTTEINTELKIKKDILSASSQKKEILISLISNTNLLKEIGYIIVFVVSFWSISCIIETRFELNKKWENHVLFISFFIYITIRSYKINRQKNKIYDQIQEQIKEIEKKIEETNTETETAIEKIDISKLERMMKSYLTNNHFSSLEINNNTRTYLTAFDFEVSHKVVKKDENYGYLTPEENNLVRLACHILLKAEWSEWVK